MRIVSNGNQYDMPDSLNGPVNTVTVWVSALDSMEWKGPVSFDVDTDSSGMVLCESTLDALQIKLIPIGAVDIELADGEIKKDPLMALNLRVESVGIRNVTDFYGVTVSVTKGTTNLLGMSLLKYFDLLIQQGVLIKLSFNDRAPMATAKR